MKLFCYFDVSLENSGSNGQILFSWIITRLRLVGHSQSGISLLGINFPLGQGSRAVTLLFSLSSQVSPTWSPCPGPKYLSFQVLGWRAMPVRWFLTFLMLTLRQKDRHLLSVIVYLPNCSFSFTMAELFNEWDCYHSTSLHSLKEGTPQWGDSAQSAWYHFQRLWLSSATVPTAV